MSWTWNWWLFLVSTFFFTVLSQFARGMMNRSNMARYGQRADWRAEPGMAILGCAIAGAIYAAALTAVLGFVL